MWSASWKQAWQTTQVSSPTWHVRHFQITSPCEKVFEQTRCGAAADRSRKTAVGLRATASSRQRTSSSQSSQEASCSGGMCVSELAGLSSICTASPRPIACSATRNARLRAADMALCVVGWMGREQLGAGRCVEALPPRARKKCKTNFGVKTKDAGLLSSYISSNRRLNLCRYETQYF